MSSTFGCPHCGKTNPLHATFCVSCGTYLAGLDTEGLARAAARPSVDRPTGDKPIDEDGSPLDVVPDDKTAANPSPGKTTPNVPTFQPWLHSNVDKSDPEPQIDQPELRDQRWLHPQEDDQDAIRPPASAPQRLIGGLQGLIDPAELTSDQFPADLPAVSTPMMVDIPYEMRRELRQIFAADVPILDDRPNSITTSEPSNGQGTGQGKGLWRYNWIYGLMLAGILLGMWANNAPASGRPHSWPGIVEAYNAIDTLPTNSIVLVNWAYDPSTAGEMDLAAYPIVAHLLEKNAHLLVVSQLPGGPATARRMIAQARADAPQTSFTRHLRESLFEGGYLPGGVASLPLLGQAPAQSMPVDMYGRAINNRVETARWEENNPALLLILAGRSEEVQRWVEQVQPLNRAPIVAVIGAAADPVVRPYVDSGQISGLVSGYAGGVAYQDLRADAISASSQERQRRHISGQNWALAVLLLVIVLGNLAGLAQRSTS